MKSAYLFAVCVIIVSCNKKQDVYISCEQQRDNAQKDFQNRKYIYFESIHRTDKPYDQQAFRNLLKQKNIKVVFDTVSPEGCIPQYDAKNEKCYRQTMNYMMDAKFDNRFFDSLRVKSAITK